RTAPGNGQVAAACEDSGSEGHSQPGPSTAFGSGKYTPHAGAAECVSKRLSERMLLSIASKLNITDLSRAYPGVSTVTAMITGAVLSGPFTNSIFAIFAVR